MKQDDSSIILGFRRNIFTASLLKVFYGGLSDRTGHRKWLMALGHGISTLSGLLWDRIGPSATFLFGTATSYLAAILFCGFLFFTKAEKKAGFGGSV